MGSENSFFWHYRCALFEWAKVFRVKIFNFLKAIVTFVGVKNVGYLSIVKMRVTLDT